MKKVYICSPCRGDYENNIQRAKEFSRAAVERGCIPITPAASFCTFRPSGRWLAATSISTTGPSPSSWTVASSSTSLSA